MQTCRGLFILPGSDSGKQLLGKIARAVLMSVVAAALVLSAAVACAGDVYDDDAIEVEGQRPASTASMRSS
jgi:hypothetical protein